MVWIIILLLIIISMFIYEAYIDDKRFNIQADIHQKRYYRIKLEHCEMLEYLNEWQGVLGKRSIQLRDDERR